MNKSKKPATPAAVAHPPVITHIPDDRLTGPERGSAPIGKEASKTASGKTKTYRELRAD